MKFWTVIFVLFLTACSGRTISKTTVPLISASIPAPTSLADLTAIATQAPISTLSVAESNELIKELILRNGGCRLPCFWGITPGITEWSEAKNFLATFAEIREGKFYSIKIQDPEYHQVNLIEFTVQDGIVVEVVAGLPITRNFTIDKLLTNYGKPDGIYLLTYKNSPASPIPAFLALNYQHQGILVEYEFASEKINDNEFLICSQPLGPNMWLRSSQETLTDLDINQSVLGAEPSYTLRKIDEISNISIDEFFNDFKGSSACFITPINVWP